MTGTTREKQFKDWLKKTFSTIEFDLEKVNCEGLPDFYCHNKALFFEVKYRQSGGVMPVWSLFSKKQKDFIENNRNKVLVGYRTSEQPWGIYAFHIGAWEERDYL